MYGGLAGLGGDNEGLYDEPAFAHGAGKGGKHNPIYSSHENLAGDANDSYLEAGAARQGGDGCKSLLFGAL